MARLSVIVSPGAARAAVVGRHGDGWKGRVAAVAERGRANEAAVLLLTEALQVERGAVRVVAGRTSRRKVVEVAGLDDSEAGRRLDAAVRR